MSRERPELEWGVGAIWKHAGTFLRPAASNMSMKLVATGFSLVAIAALSACGSRSGQPRAQAATTTTSSDPGMAAANAEAQRILNRVELPPSSHQVRHLSGAQFAGGVYFPACNPQTDDTRFWTLSGSVGDVVAYVKAHPAIGTPGSQGYGTTGGNAHSAYVIMEYIDTPQPQQETLDVTIGQLADGQVGVRADAYVAPPSSACSRSGTAGRAAG